MGGLVLKYRGHRVPLRFGETVVGRSAYCTIVIQHPDVSRQHCVLALKDGAVVVRDLDSRNGTWVNGERIAGARLLAEGDVVRVGREQLEIVRWEQEARAGQVATLQDDDAPTEDPSDFADTSTVTSQSTVELCEALVATAQTAEQRLAAVRAIRSAVDGLRRVGLHSLSQRDRRRVARVIAAIADWDSGSDFTSWCAEVTTGATGAQA